MLCAVCQDKIYFAVGSVYFASKMLAATGLAETK